jgi:hypothetical protein
MAQAPEMKEIVSLVMTPDVEKDAAPISLRGRVVKARWADPIGDEWRNGNSAMVLNFFSELTGSSYVANSIMIAASEHSIPFALAFAIAYEESRFKPRATHVNKNGSVDRGLFQLNSGVHLDIELARFFDPDVNAKRGLRYLRSCLEETGSVAAGIAAYNAGLGRVDARNVTPRSTVEYVGRVFEYRDEIEEMFRETVSKQGDYAANHGSSGNHGRE